MTTTGAVVFLVLGFFGLFVTVRNAIHDYRFYKKHNWDWSLDSGYIVSPEGLPHRNLKEPWRFVIYFIMLLLSLGGCSMGVLGLLGRI